MGVSSILVLQFLGEKFSYCILALVTSPGLRNVFIIFQSSFLMDVLQLKTRQRLQEEVISCIRATDIPAETGQCLGTLSSPSSLEQKQATPDSSPAVVYQFGLGKIIVAVNVEEPRLFDPPLLTCCFTIWLYCGASQLDPWVRNSCSLSGEWWKREPGWAPSLSNSGVVTVTAVVHVHP